MRFNKNKLLRITIKAKNLPFALFVLLFLLLSYLIVAFIFVFYSPTSTGAEYLRHKDPIYMFFSTCFVAPLVETFINQALVINLVRNYISKKMGIQITISALLFALAHWYSLWYVVFAFLVGTILATGYVIYQRKSKFGAFFAIATVHFLRNLISFTANFYPNIFNQ